MKNKRGRRLIGAGLLMIASAACLTGYNFYDAYRAQASASRAMAEIFPLIGSSTAQGDVSADVLPSERVSALPVEDSSLIAAGAGQGDVFQAEQVSTLPAESSSLTAAGTAQGDAAADVLLPEGGSTPQLEDLALSVSGMAQGDAAADVLQSTNPLQQRLPTPTGGETISTETEAVKGTVRPGRNQAASNPTPVPKPEVDLIFPGVTSNPTEIEYADYLLNPEMAMPVVSNKGQDYIGILEIPDFGLELPVISEWSYPRLKIAPCRYTGSAYKNNMVICAHNYGSHFGNLKKLKLGSRIYFTDVDGNRFTYQVALKETLAPNSVWDMTHHEFDLTLFTCTVGGAQRVTIHCERVLIP